MNNYEFCARWALEHCADGQATVLDYGCGSGQIVQLLRRQGCEGFGCDVFYAGGDASGAVDPSLMAKGIVRRMEDGAIPFETGFFDLVVNNQVMEHVEDLDRALAEIARVLKPGGKVLSVFPHQEVWREGHSGIPFLHWFPRRSRTRVYYAATLRTLGLGHFKGAKSRWQWSLDFCDWLDRWTHYRTLSQIRSAYERHFTNIGHQEAAWLIARLEARGRGLALLPRPLLALAARKLGGLVVVARKPA